MSQSIWSIYLVASVLFPAILCLLFRKRFRVSTLLACFILIISPLLVPYAVDSIDGQAQQLAPAWMVAIFEAIQGKSALAVAAIRSVILVECAILVVILLWIYLNRRYSTSRN